MSLDTESHPPISRESMRGLKAQTDEKIRIARTNQFVSEIYRLAAGAASTTEATSYAWAIQNVNVPTNFIPDIIKGLQSLFPECSVEYKLMSRSPDGKMCDISKMDAAAREFIKGLRHHQTQEAIVVDWS